PDGNLNFTVKDTGAARVARRDNVVFVLTRDPAGRDPDRGQVRHQFDGAAGVDGSVADAIAQEERKEDRHQECKVAAPDLAWAGRFIGDARFGERGEQAGHHYGFSSGAEESAMDESVSEPVASGPAAAEPGD